MRLRFAAVTALIVLLSSVWLRVGSSAIAQDGAEATIAALQTRVAELEATAEARGEKINAQRTKIAELEATIGTTLVPTETPEPSTSTNIEWTDIGRGISFYDYYAEDDFGFVLLLGEFRNTNDHAVPVPIIRFTLLDEDGNIVTSTIVSEAHPFIGARDTTPFQIVVDDVHLGDWASESFEVINIDDTAVSCSANLELRNLQEEKDSNSLRVTGSVFNGGDAAVDGISIVAAAYRSDGRYAGRASDYVQASVPAGKSARFNVFGTKGSFPGVNVIPISEEFTYRMFVFYIPGGAGFPQC